MSAPWPYICPEPGCGKEFRKFEGIKQHYQDVHRKALPFSEEACRNIHCAKWTPEQVAQAITGTFYS